MTTSAAGILILCGGKALFLQRADTGQWAFPGGHLEAGETAEEAAVREAREEIGSAPYGNPTALTRRIADGVDFTTFAAQASAEFVPTLNAEHTAWTWAPIDQPPQPLHPGCAVALARPDMDELGVARAMAAGDLVSPQQYGNVWLFAIRITGTGAAYRAGLNEYVWRDSSHYLTNDFLARCNGLPVIWEHPVKKPKLDSKEFNDRVIGAVMLPYFQGDEVWGIARVYDEDAVTLMRGEQLSTSPGVVFSELSGNETVKLEDGSHLLIEGKPKLLDHIAVCSAGVWDRGGPPTGVSTTLTEEPIGMTDEEKAAADKARKDSDEMGTKLDAALAKLDAAHARMDAMEKADKARKDADEIETKKREEEERDRKDRSRRDAARKDRFGARKDGESDDDFKKRFDADEMAMCDAMRKDGEDETVAKDFAGRARKDAEEADKTAREDKARKDAEESKRMDTHRADAAAQEIADLKAKLAAVIGIVENMNRETPIEERDMLARAQARADSVAGLFGERAAAPIPGETSLAYRKRLLGKFKGYSAKFKEKRFDSLDGDMLGPIEEIIYNDAVATARSPDRASPGILIPIIETDPVGRRITRYTGDPLAWMAPFMRGGQVGRFSDPRQRH